VRPSSSEFPPFPLVRYPLGRDRNEWTKSLAPPFFDHFSPFSTIYPADLNRDSPQDSKHRAISDRRAAIKKWWKWRRPLCCPQPARVNVTRWPSSGRTFQAISVLFPF